MKISFQRLVLAVFCLALTLVVLFSTKELSVVENGKLSVQDFAYHYILAERFWSSAPKNIYSFSEQKRILSEQFGIEISSAMPIGMTPTFLLPFGAISFFAKDNVDLAYLIWAVLSSFLLVSALGRNLVTRHHAFLAIAMMAAGPFVNAVQLGQTSIFALAVMLVIFARTRLIDNSTKDTHQILFLAFLMALLSIKPQYFLATIPLVLPVKGWKPIFYSGLFILILWSMLTFWLTPLWFFDYMSNLSGYATNRFPTHYSVWLTEKLAVPLIFGEAVHDLSASSLLRTSLYIVGVVFSLIMADRAYKSSIACEHKGGDNLESTREVLHMNWGLYRTLSILSGYAAFFLFTPHLGSYEWIILLVPAYYLIERGVKYEQR